jgi:hypothetical protein
MLNSACPIPMHKMVQCNSCVGKQQLSVVPEFLCWLVQCYSGTEAPCAYGELISIGAIGGEKNKKVSRAGTPYDCRHKQQDQQALLSRISSQSTFLQRCNGWHRNHLVHKLAAGSSATGKAPLPPVLMLMASAFLCRFRPPLQRCCKASSR